MIMTHDDDCTNFVECIYSVHLITRDSKKFKMGISLESFINMVSENRCTYPTKGLDFKL